MEAWLPVVGYEEFYEISNRGNIRALPRERKSVNLYGPYTTVCKGFMMKPKIDRYGYKQIGLRGADGVRKFFTIHRLVITAFQGPMPEGCNQVNHIDGDKLNNLPWNLEWCDGKHNQQESMRLGTHTLCLHRCPETGRVMSKDSPQYSEAQA